MVFIEIAVYIHGIILEYVDKAEVVVEMEEGSTVSDLIEKIGIRQDVIGTVRLNKNSIVRKNYPLKNKDRIDVYPFFGGG